MRLGSETRSWCVATGITLLATACSDGLTTPGGDDRAVIRGRAHAPAGYDLSGLWAIWRAEGAQRADSAPLGPGGVFEIRTSAGRRGELLIDGAAPRVFHPFLYPFDVDSLDDAAIVLVPRAWTIRTGIYQGGVVETPLDPVMDDDMRLSYTYFFARADPPNDPVRYLVDLRTWPEANLPARVAIDHRHSTRNVTAQDSADIWRVLNRMEEVFGLNLFEPSVADPEWWPEPWRWQPAEFVPGVIRLGFRPPSWGAGLRGDEPLAWDQELGTWASDGRFTALHVNHELLNSGMLSIGELEPLRLADGLVAWETVLMHEMLHVLGVGHTCRVPSPQGPCVRTAEPSRQDVAYIELLREVMRLERMHGTFLGILPATIGERKLLLGLPALPALMPSSLTATSGAGGSGSYEVVEFDAGRSSVIGLGGESAR